MDVPLWAPAYTKQWLGLINPSAADLVLSDQDPATRQIVMANAGALPPMICRGADILKIRVEGVPLGLLGAREYEESVFQAQAGDVLVLYSDGITDHLNAGGTAFGRHRLATAERTHCRLSRGI